MAEPTPHCSIGYLYNKFRVLIRFGPHSTHSTVRHLVILKRDGYPLEPHDMIRRTAYLRICVSDFPSGCICVRRRRGDLDIAHVFSAAEANGPYSTPLLRFVMVEGVPLHQSQLANFAVRWRNSPGLSRTLSNCGYKDHYPHQQRSCLPQFD